MGLLSSLFTAKSTDYKAMIERGAIVVDVRSPQEYAGGHIQGSINIPLDQISTKTDMLLKKGKPVITCCRSGSRSGMAVEKLKSAGIDAYNAGAWDSLKQKI
ncbi:rhodanese-like domain-containing protein [Dyadobacter psychrophilus]|uniref:Rhodanese-like domain-containing protein n=1 Tax=Dyadobacter psychrophilus TaxID=651661 RepID=A0A1T5B8J8_9BACT|nr:rhodanese-like domain-containing protein [Dyadobacter psychrophilus]SKB43572.1 Rhodanese-like domain-containing protein [Dyadobacter psychrophilus]